MARGHFVLELGSPRTDAGVLLILYARIDRWKKRTGREGLSMSWLQWLDYCHESA